jgi:CAAX prenyl protease-like protein
MRRLAHSDFESVPFAEVRWPALAMSSVVFGLGHGALWLPGILAGCVFGLLVIRSGRLGEALAAHVTANALLAMLILTGDQWQLW